MKTTELARRAGCVLVPIVILLLSLGAGYLALFYGWLTATPSAKEWHRTASNYLCAAVPVGIVCAGVAAWVLRPKGDPKGACAECGYSMAGLGAGAPCPECGALQDRDRQHR